MNHWLMFTHYAHDENTKTVERLIENLLDNGTHYLPREEMIQYLEDNCIVYELLDDDIRDLIEEYIW